MTWKHSPCPSQAQQEAVGVNCRNSGWVSVVFSGEKSRLPREAVELDVRGLQSHSGQRHLWTERYS